MAAGTCVVRSNLRLIIRVMAPPHPVHLAARSGDLDCIRKLLAWGADRLQRDSAGGELDPCHGLALHIVGLLNFVL